MKSNGARTGAEEGKYFNFSREMMGGPIYRKYEKAVSGIWNPSRARLLPGCRGLAVARGREEEGLLGITVRFFAGEQRVTDELVPMLAAARRWTATTG